MRSWWRGLVMAAVALTGIVGCGSEAPKRNPQASAPTTPAPAVTVSGAPAPAVSSEAVKVLSSRGTVLIRDEVKGGAYRTVEKGSSIGAGETVLSFHDGVISSANGKVQATLRSDLSGKNPLPVLESAVATRMPSSGVDLELKLDRGRVDFVNTAKEGKVTVKVVGPFTSSELVLASPGTRVEIELYGRWLPGSRFAALPENTKYVPENSPVLRWMVLVLKGEVEIQHPLSSFSLKAPPGNALIQAQTINSERPVPEHLDSLPDWVNEDPKDPEVAKTKPALEKLAAALASHGDASKVFEEFSQSKDPVERIIAVYGLAAIDELEKMFVVIRSSKQEDVVDEGIIALRHYLGRGPGVDQAFYKFLMTHQINNQPVFKPSQAEALIDLVYGFNEEQKAQPTTYSYLLKQLSNKRQAFRGLAIWHLERLVPDGQKIGYDPTDEEPARELSIKKWRDKLTELKKLPEPLPAAKPPVAKPAAPKP
jgi:hypothetical protein